MDQEAESFSFFPPPDTYSDLDSSFTSSKTSASTFSARSSLSLPSFSSSSSSSLSSSSSSAAAPRPLPHHKTDPHWSALRAVANLSQDGLLHLRHFHLLRPLGSGHLARVFHCRIAGFDETNSDGVQPDFALKVIDLDALARSSTDADNHNADDGAGDGKMWHVRAEARALAELDHPFLPTLYARLDASHYACFLIDYCPGGDINALLHRVRGHRLPLSAARFYTSEVLLALEYLHTLGIVYRDLKPENVLLRADGHIMLSDFDLSFCSDVSPALLRHNQVRRRRRRRSLCGSFPATGDEEECCELEFVAEPQAAFSKACVGTHEYLAPEVANGSGHGNGVDWWAFGVFLYELLYGRTPFKGATKEATLRNILTRDVSFPETKVRDVSGEVAKAKDLIERLLVKDPRRRMGATGGAAEIKRHPFFEGVQWALVRCARPPIVPGEPAARSRGSSGSGVQWRVSKEEKGKWWRWWSSNSRGNDDDGKQKKKVELGFGMRFGSSNGNSKKIKEKKSGK